MDFPRRPPLLKFDQRMNHPDINVNNCYVPQDDGSLKARGTLRQIICALDCLKDYMFDDTLVEGSYSPKKYVQFDSRYDFNDRPYKLSRTVYSLEELSNDGTGLPAKSNSRLEDYKPRPVLNSLAKDRSRSLRSGARNNSQKSFEPRWSRQSRLEPKSAGVSRQIPRAQSFINRSTPQLLQRRQSFNYIPLKSTSKFLLLNKDSATRLNSPLRQSSQRGSLGRSNSQIESQQLIKSPLILTNMINDPSRENLPPIKSPKFIDTQIIEDVEVTEESQEASYNEYIEIEDQSPPPMIEHIVELPKPSMLKLEAQVKARPTRSVIEPLKRDPDYPPSTLNNFGDGKTTMEVTNPSRRQTSNGNPTQRKYANMYYVEESDDDY